jgi:hypothetical protein
MFHVLLTLNEPLLQRSRPRGPLGLSLTTSPSENVFNKQAQQIENTKVFYKTLKCFAKQNTQVFCHKTLWCFAIRLPINCYHIAGSRRVLATAVDDWSGKPYALGMVQPWVGQFVSSITLP